MHFKMMLLNSSISEIAIHQQQISRTPRATDAINWLTRIKSGGKSRLMALSPEDEPPPPHY